MSSTHSLPSWVDSSFSLLFSLVLFQFLLFFPSLVVSVDLCPVYSRLLPTYAFLKISKQVIAGQPTPHHSFRLTQLRVRVSAMRDEERRGEERRGEERRGEERRGASECVLVHRNHHIPSYKITQFRVASYLFCPHPRNKYLNIAG